MVSHIIFTFFECKLKDEKFVFYDMKNEGFVNKNFDKTRFKKNSFLSNN